MVDMITVPSRPTTTTAPNSVKKIFPDSLRRGLYGVFLVILSFVLDVFRDVFKVSTAEKSPNIV